MEETMTYLQWLVNHKLDIFTYICFVLLIVLLIAAFFSRANKEMQIQTGGRENTIKRIYNRPMLIISLLSMLLVCLLAQSVSCYVIMIIIVATLMTDLQFPLMLAAMFTKNKDYFDYMSKIEQRDKTFGKIEEENNVSTMEEKSPADTEVQSAREPAKQKPQEPLKPTEEKKFFPPVGLKNINRQNIKSQPHTNMSLNRVVDKYMLVEDRTIAWLQNKYNKEIKKHVSLRGHRGIEFDGVMELLRYDIVFEIRYNPNPASTTDILRRQISEVLVYQRARGRETELHYIVVASGIDRKKYMQGFLEHTYKGMTTIIEGITVKFEVIQESEIFAQKETTDFKEFMDAVDWNELTIQEKKALYETARGNASYGGIPFGIQPYGSDDEDVMISYANSDLSLRLTKKSMKQFAQWLEDTYMQGEDGDSYLSSLEAMEKDD